MCQACTSPSDNGRSSQQRKKLWEVEECYHCIILGTCLSNRDLQKITSKAKIRLKPDATEYVIHATFVTCVTQRKDVARLLQKSLDRKYRSSIEAIKKIACREELLEHWNKNLKSGSIPGPFWTIMSHQLADDGLSQQIFGDVHMLSHMVGATNRADLQRLDQLEHGYRSIAVEREEERLRSRQILNERNAIIADLNSQIDSQSKLRGRIVGLEAQLAQFENHSAYMHLKKITRKQQSELVENTRIIEQMGQLLTEHDAANARNASEIQKLKKLLTSFRSEVGQLERMLEKDMFNAEENGDEKYNRKSKEFDLNGATIIYIGGRTSQIHHFKKLVEYANGDFIHHDGGLEESGQRLHQILSRGDIVMCPIDCVSHGACLRAKKFCKHAGKCFVPLRSTGLSCFLNGLHDASIDS